MIAQSNLQPLSRPRFLSVVGTILIIDVLALLSLGRRLWCRCDSLTPWSWEVHSQHTSQHLIDWYSTTHVVHGFLLYALATLLLGRSSIAARFLCVLLLESVWEIAENSPFIIERYRATTIALDYVGDSVLNSMSDIAMCLAGFLFAARAAAKTTIALAVALELFTVAMIRDNLTLNILMLICPLDAMKVWQSG